MTTIEIPGKPPIGHLFVKCSGNAYRWHRELERCQRAIAAMLRACRADQAIEQWRAYLWSLPWWRRWAVTVWYSL